MPGADGVPEIWQSGNRRAAGAFRIAMWAAMAPKFAWAIFAGIAFAYQHFGGEDLLNSTLAALDEKEDATDRA
jgi:hypothetical protein